MGDSWGNAPKGNVENTWPVLTHEDNSNPYIAPRNDPVDDHERPPNRRPSPIRRENNRDLEPGSRITNKERAPSSHSKEQIRYKDSDRVKRSSENGDWNSQNRPLERKDDNFNPRQKSYQTSNYDDKAELYETGVPSQKGFNDDNWNSGRSPIPTDDIDKRRDPRNSRGSYKGYENDSDSGRPSSYDRMNDSHMMHSLDIQRKPNEDEGSVRNSLAENRSIVDDFERRDEKKKSTENQDLKLRENRMENSMGGAQLEPIKGRFRDVVVQTEQIDMEPIIQLINSRNPELGDVVRKKLFSLGFGRNTLSSSTVPTQGHSLLDMGADELNDYEKRRGNVRRDFNDSRKSQSVSRSTYSQGVDDVSQDLDNTWNNNSKTDNYQESSNRLKNTRNSYNMEYESQQLSNAPGSRNREQKSNFDDDSQGSQKTLEPFRATTRTPAKSLEPWEIQDNQPRTSEMRAASPDYKRKPLEDRDVSSNNVASIRGSHHPPTSESRWNQMENQKRSEFRNYPNESSRVSKQEKDQHLEYELRSYTPKADPRTSSPRDVSRLRDSSISSRRNDAPKMDPRSSSPHSINRPRDSSVSSKVSQQRIDAQKNIDPQEVVVNKPPVEKNNEIGGSNPPSKDSWESGPTDPNDWLQKAALFEQEINGHPKTRENDRPAKKDPEPWENQKSNSGEPWEMTTQDDNSNNPDVLKNNGRSGHFENVGNRIEQRDDHYRKSSAYNNDRACYNCNKTGHLSRECPEQPEDSSRRKNCHICNKPGHLSYNCPESNHDNNGERFSRGCYTCGSHDHIANNCPSKTKPSPFVDPEPSGISAEEAWSRLLKADQEQDIEDFKKWLEEFAKASPNETFQSIERKLRSHGCTGRIVALKREGIPFTSCLIDLQGNSGKTYVAQPVFGGKNRIPKSSGTYANSEKENLEWLADAGFLCDDPSPACFNCKQKGHSSRQCPMPKKENDRPGYLECQHCHSHDHMTKHCNRRDRNERPYGGHGYGDKDTRGQSGYNRREHGRSDRFGDNNPYTDGTYGSDERKFSSNFESYDNDGRGGNRRRDFVDDYSATFDKPKNNDSFNKNRYNSNQGSYNNDDKNFSRTRGGYNGGYSQRDFNDQGGRYLNQRGNNGNRDRGDYGLNEDRNSANRGYPRNNRESDGYFPRNQRDRSRDRTNRVTDSTIQKWDTRNRSISINRGNEDVEPASKKDTGNWDRTRNEASQNTVSNRTYDDNSWPMRDEEKKRSYGNNNNDKFFENQRPRGNDGDELRGRSAQTKEVLASNSGSRNGSTRNSTFDHDRNYDRKATSNIDNVEAWW